MSGATHRGSTLPTLAGALLAGLIFGIGLILAGMSNPAKVLAFLDLAGDWDPSLALVMVSGIAVTRVGLLVGRHTGRSASGEPFHASSHRPPDRRLLAGSALFGLGWGLAGFCPGPAVVAVGAGYLPALPLAAGMLIGLWVRRPAGGAR